MEILSQLFGGPARVKVMRLFLFNEERQLTIEDIAQKTRLAKSTISRELRALEKMGMIKKKELARPRKAKSMKKGTKTTSKKRSRGYLLNPRFIYAGPLRQLLSLNDPIAHKDIVDKLRRVGKLRLVIVTGLFIGRETDRVDLLIVGDNIKKAEVERALQVIEGEVGTEIAYAYFDTDDFLYRINVHDRLVHDVLDYPHERLVNRIDDFE